MTTAPTERPHGAEPIILPTSAHWRPSDRQRTVYDIIKNAKPGSRTIIGYGGAAGGGKTITLAELPIDMGLQRPDSRMLIGRAHFVHLETTTLEQFDRLIPPPCLARKYDSSPVYRDIRPPKAPPKRQCRQRVHDYPNEVCDLEAGHSGYCWPAGHTSRVYFRGVDNAQDSIGSEEYDWIFLEEAHEIRERDILYLFSRLRHQPATKWGMVVAFNPLPGFPVRWFMTGPEGVGDAVMDGTKIVASRMDVSKLEGLGELHFVPSRMTDNPGLDKGYEAFLRATYPPHLAQMMIDGLKGGVENAAYPHFHRAYHVRELEEGVRFVDGAFGVDYGRVHMSAAVAVRLDQYNRAWVVEAWGQPSTDHGQELARQVGYLRGRYNLTRGRADPNQDVLAGLVGASLAKGQDGSRNHRIMLTGRRFSDFPGGKVPDIMLEALGMAAHQAGAVFNIQQTPLPHVEAGPGADSPGLFLLKGAPGIDALAEQIEAYHHIERENDRAKDLVIARKDDDLVAALEYAIEELDEGAHFDFDAWNNAMARR